MTEYIPDFICFVLGSAGVVLLALAFMIVQCALGKVK